jgi:hypothetical protein
MTRRILAVSGGLVLAVTLPSCDSGSPTQTQTTTTTTLPPCNQTTVFQGSGSLPPLTIDEERFTTGATSRVDVTVDWTFPASVIGVYVVQGGCTLDQFNARSCNFLIRSDSGSKPRKVSAPNVAAGTYSLLLANFADQDESLSAQVVQSSVGCPALTSATATHDASRSDMRRMSRELLHR